MGIGMQIAYLGLQGTASLEAEAVVQLLRLQPYSTYEFRMVAKGPEIARQYL
jgi:hypothetical protein